MDKDSSQQKTSRETVLGWIRALRAKTVENGCTEGEAAEAAAKIAKLLAKHDIDLDEVDLKSSGFAQREWAEDSEICSRLWPIVSEIGKLTSTRAWGRGPGEGDGWTFFGISHEVEIAHYLLDICVSAMRFELAAVREESKFLRPVIRRRKETGFLDGMARRLAERLQQIRLERDAKLSKGALVPVRNALIDQALKDSGIELKKARGGYRDVDLLDVLAGTIAGDRVRFDPGIGHGRPAAAIEKED
jgi:hypothetical protein